MSPCQRTCARQAAICTLVTVLVLSSFTNGVRGIARQQLAQTSLAQTSLAQTSLVTRGDFLQSCDYCVERAIDARNANCSSLWPLFDSGQRTLDFSTFLDAQRPFVPASDLMLFSGTTAIVRYVALKRSKLVLPNFIVGCIATHVQGGNWFNDGSSAFYHQSSRQVAASATGTVEILLSASAIEPDKPACPPMDNCQPAFRPSSFFGVDEITHLDSSKVTVLRAINIPFGNEVCGQGSLLNLSAEAESFGLNFECVTLPVVQAKAVCAFLNTTQDNCANYVESAPDTLTISWSLPWFLISLTCLVVPTVLFCIIWRVALRRRKREPKPMRGSLLHDRVAGRYDDIV